MRAEDLIGTWRLVTIEGKSTTGDISFPYGQHPVGLLLYDQLGNMSVVFMKQGRPKFADADPVNATAEELRSAFDGFDAYCGRYTLNVDEETVTHHLIACKVPNREGTDLVRHVTFADGELRLRTLPIMKRGVEWTIYVVWQPAALPITT